MNVNLFVWKYTNFIYVKKFEKSTMATEPFLKNVKLNDENKFIYLKI